jgi:hypothetical protein
MKIHLIIFISMQFLFFNVISSAQTITSNEDKKIEASVLCGWLLAGNTPGTKIINAPVYSGTVAYVRNSNVMYELSVNSFFSKIKYNAYQGHSDTSVRYSQTYIMLGIVRTFKTEIPNFTPYLSTNIGLVNTHIQVSSGTSYSPTQLAAGLLGGIKVDLNSRIGLKFQARVQAPLSGLGLRVGISTGGPTVGIGSYSGTIQFDVSTGLFFRL